MSESSVSWRANLALALRVGYPFLPTVCHWSTWNLWSRNAAVMMLEEAQHVDSG